MTPGRVLSPIVLGGALLLAVASIAVAQSASIGVYLQGTTTKACDLTGGQFYMLEVRLVHTVGPVKTARFKVVPSCPVTGGPFEFDLTFPNCIADGATMATIFVIADPCNQTYGLWFDVVPATGETKIRLTDCDGYAMTGMDAFQTTDYDYPCDDVSWALGPYRPTPPDGATGVPVNTVLGYVGNANVIIFSDQPFDDATEWSHVLCAAQPDPFYSAPPCTYPVDPGPLLPYTTYYWRAWNVPWYSYAPAAGSEVYTFTTGGPVTAEPSTWGRVKALYRD